MSVNFSPVVGRGFPLPVQGDFRPLVLSGMPALLPLDLPAPKLTETALAILPTDPLPGGFSGSDLLVVSPAVLRDTSGSVIVPTANGYVNLGKGAVLGFDPTTQQGKITPALTHNILQDFSLYLGDAPLTFTGSDLRIMLEVADPPKIGDAKARFNKQLLECTTLSVSVHRSKAPVAAAGYINSKGFARGRRTIAGTMVMTQFTTDVFLRFLQDVLVKEDASKSDYYSKPDQIPPLNMTMFFSNEQGFASYRRVLGIEFVTDGVVYSSQDMLSEQTISYYAADITPLLPLTLSALNMPQDRRRKREKTIQDIWDKNNPPVLIAGDSGTNQDV
jgi:hypothetical protein